MILFAEDAVLLESTWQNLTWDSYSRLVPGSTFVKYCEVGLVESPRAYHAQLKLDD